MWLVFGMPALVVAAGVRMVFIAGAPGSTDAVPDLVYRTAQVQTADLGADAAARDAGISALVRIDAGAGTVEVLPVSGRFDRDTTLRLTLLHPVRADADRELLLQPAPAGWRTAATPASAHDWNVRLSPLDGSWRLQGRWPRGQAAARLRPVLRSP